MPMPALFSALPRSRRPRRAHRDAVLAREAAREAQARAEALARELAGRATHAAHELGHEMAGAVPHVPRPPLSLPRRHRPRRRWGRLVLAGVALAAAYAAYRWWQGPDYDHASLIHEPDAPRTAPGTPPSEPAPHAPVEPPFDDDMPVPVNGFDPVPPVAVPTGAL